MRITVKTGCRLHLGFLDLTGDLGRLYGSIGVSLENPGTVITAAKSRQLIIDSNNREKAILDVVTRFSRHYQLEPAVRIHVADDIPWHSGLGSGTQLALAVATALAKMFDINASVREISGIVDRGKRSGVGIACFEGGGFIVDAGRKNGGKDVVSGPPSIIFRHDFPADWCFVIVIPEAEKGLFGRDEENAMSSLNPSKRISEEICRLTQMKLLPALIDRDIVEFGEALTEIDMRTGMYFEETQGGIYKEAISRDLVRFMLECGICGVGQSSWGPTIYGLVEENGARAIADKAKRFLAERKIGCEAFVSHCRNKGAEITVSD